MSELRPQLDWIPAGKPQWHSGWINGYARGLELVLNYLGHDVDYHTIMGVSIPQAVEGVSGAGADILGANCISGINPATQIIKRMRALTDKPLMAEPNAGVPRLVSGETIYDESPEEMAAGIDDLIAAGVNIIGGCCGTTPEHIRRISQKVKKYQTNLEE